VGLAVLPTSRPWTCGSRTWRGGTGCRPTLANAVADRIEREEQSLLFLNRRGYAPVTLCRACGHQMGCPQCDARLVEHRFMRG
jgi:primosomal protein N' (replication factor Y)